MSNRTKGGEFLIKETDPKDIFIPEDYTEEQHMIADSCKEFLDAEVFPNLDRIDSMEEGLMPSLLDKAGDLGLLGISVPEDLGGFGKGFVTSMLTASPSINTFSEGDIKKYVNEFLIIKNIKIGGSNIYFGKNDWETTLREATELEKENNRTASQLSSKLQCFRWVKIFNTIEQKGKLKDFLSTLYFGAKKQYDTAGPFLKIS